MRGKRTVPSGEQRRADLQRRTVEFCRSPCMLEKSFENALPEERMPPAVVKRKVI